MKKIIFLYAILATTLLSAQIGDKKYGSRLVSAETTKQYADEIVDKYGGIYEYDVIASVEGSHIIYVFKDHKGYVRDIFFWNYVKPSRTYSLLIKDYYDHETDNYRYGLPMEYFKNRRIQDIRKTVVPESHWKFGKYTYYEYVLIMDDGSFITIKKNYIDNNLGGLVGRSFEDSIGGYRKGDITDF
jgi:hypothetical protein